MKKMISMLANTMVALTPTLAAAQVGKEEGGGGIMVWLFMGFGALIIVFQLFPGLALFAAMLKEIFSHVSEKAPLPATTKTKDKV